MTTDDRKPPPPFAPQRQPTPQQQHPGATAGPMATQGGQPHHDEDKHAADHDKKAAPATPEVKPMSADQVSTPPSSPPHLGGKQVVGVIGPYRGTLLTMPEAEADQAINDHWAIENPTPPFDPNAERHPPLDDAEREAAEKAAQDWADAQKPPPEPEPKKQKHDAPDEHHDKALEAEHPPGDYQTRTLSEPPKKK